MHITGYNWLYNLMNITGYNWLYNLMHITGYFVLAVEDLYETPSDLWLPGVAGPKFDIISRYF